jgi:alpha-tubulin suppressor-like RCC1 family protein
VSPFLGASAYGFTLALTEAGVYAWGPNDYGQLGHDAGLPLDLNCSDDAGVQHPCTATPTPVQGLP